LLDSIYGQVMRVRRRRYERHPQRQRRLRAPVISVGNLSMGGTGKSPVVAAIAQWLIAQGHRPAILSRGYARADAADGVVVVSDGGSIMSTLDRSGDEPMMLARQVPGAIVCVSPERYLSGTLAERELGATVHVLDDGFQHIELARDLDVLVTRVGEIPGGRVIPAGRLRESMDAAARAHVLVVSDATAGAAASEAWTLGVSQSCAAVRKLQPPIGLKPDAPSSEAATTAVLAVAGIAHPERFVQSLKDAGWNVVDAVTFKDHHRYSPSDVASIQSRVAASGASAVFTTDKDAVRFEVVDVPFALYRVPLQVEFEPAAALFESIRTVLGSSSVQSSEPGREQ
jgi:tetraacyldisaccharide 4'-kinase